MAKTVERNCRDNRMNNDWLESRRIVLTRDNFTCRECGSGADRQNLDIHHLMPRAFGGTDDPANLITLCDGCHAAYHPTLQVGLARRLLERWSASIARRLDKEAIPSEADRFGIALRILRVGRFREGQFEVVRAALKGRSLLMVSPTGSGKSLCFQLPALLKENLTVVISPLKALMSEQIASLMRLKLPGTFINSDLDSSEKKARYNLIREGALKFLYCAPERFSASDPNEVAILRSLKPSFLVIDEAHCVDKWGQDFRPDYGRLGEIRRALGSPPVLAFTASASVETQHRILSSLGIPGAEVFVRGVDRPNIALLRISKAPESRTEIIAEFLVQRSVGKTMIFVPTKKIGDELARDLTKYGIDIPFYHAQIKSSWKRENLQQRFSGKIEPKLDSIICTNAFGMGLDIADVRLVIHWQQPASAEDYLQEFGRAGRDGKPALAVLLGDDKDVGLLKFMATKTVESAEIGGTEKAALLNSRLQMIDRMRAMASSRECFRAALIGYFQGDTRWRRRSVAERLIEWVFSSRRALRQASVCCDACSPELAQTPFEFLRTALGQSTADSQGNR
jgi:ATP-dependent DNA helicase RecQ